MRFDGVPEAGARFLIGDTVVVAYDSRIDPDPSTAQGNDSTVVGWDISALETAAAAAASFAQLELGIDLSVSQDDPTVIDLRAREPGFAGSFIALEVLGRAEGDTKDIVIQTGSDSGQSLTLSIADMRARALGVSARTPGHRVPTRGGGYAYYTEVPTVSSRGDVKTECALDLSSHEKASAAIDVVDQAIEQVSGERSKLGAYQNRLEHTVSRLGTSAENLQAAESRIRDLDMAEEIMQFTKNMILQQAATAMLAQANMAPQSVLQLLG